MCSFTLLSNSFFQQDILVPSRHLICSRNFNDQGKNKNHHCLHGRLGHNFQIRSQHLGPTLKSMFGSCVSLEMPGNTQSFTHLLQEVKFPVRSKEGKNIVVLVSNQTQQGISPNFSPIHLVDHEYCITNAQKQY